MPTTIAIVGSQNCGKTTLFNRLTGKRARSFNYPGVTVAREQGTLRGHPDVTVVDLPGIYSMSACSSEEAYACSYIYDGTYDVVINVADASNMERGMYLAMQLIEIAPVMIIALNMIDAARANGILIDTEELSQLTGVGVAAVSAHSGEGVDEMVALALNAALSKHRPIGIEYGNAASQWIGRASRLIADHAGASRLSPRYAAAQLLIGDKTVSDMLRLPESISHAVELAADKLSEQTGMDAQLAIVSARYQAAREMMDQAVRHSAASRGDTASQRGGMVDRLLLHPLLAYPCFVLAMCAVFYGAYGPIGAAFEKGFSRIITLIIRSIDTAMGLLEVNETLRTLVADGALMGVGSVINFLPRILLLFLFLALLEDSGYMARIAFIFDKPMRKIGLSGKAVVPALVGFGCSVPAILAARALPSERERKLTIVIAPFFSCGAKMPVYMTFAAAFFPASGLWVILSLYVTGVLTAICSAAVLSRTAMRGAQPPFVLELPTYRMPSAQSVLIRVYDKAIDFVSRAFSVLFIASIVIWFMTRFDFALRAVADKSQSMLAVLGNFISPVLAPLGFGDWRGAAALISGWFAKEAIVSTFGVLLGTAGGSGPGAALQVLFTSQSAYVFMVFTLLYAPCVAAFAASRRELGGFIKAVPVLLFQTCAAWAVAFVFARVLGV